MLPATLLLGLASAPATLAACRPALVLITGVDAIRVDDPGEVPRFAGDSSAR